MWKLQMECVTHCLGDWNRCSWIDFVWKRNTRWPEKKRGNLDEGTWEVRRRQSLALFSDASYRTGRDWNARGSAQTSANTFFLCRWVTTGTYYPKRLGSLPNWRDGTKKCRLDMVLGSQLWVSLLEQGLDQMASRSPFQPQLSCDFGFPDYFSF